MFFTQLVARAKKPSAIALALLFFGLTACGEPTAAPTVVIVEVPTAIPTFTLAPVTPPTATPTQIVVPPTDTPTPVIAPTPTITPRPTATFTPLPTATPRPTATPVITLSPDEIRTRYKLPLPTYLPPGFQLQRLSLQQVGNPPVVTLLGEYGTPQGARFFYSVQALNLPTVPPTVPPVSAPAETPPARPTLAVAVTQVVSQLKIEEVIVRGVKAQISYRTDFPQSTLTWNEPDKTFSLNGELSKEEVLKVVAGLQ